MTMVEAKSVLIASCLCERVELRVTGEPVICTACHCFDCSEGSRRLEALPHSPPILDSFGGTPHILYRKDQVTFLKGTELFSNIQVEEDSPKRIYASCCNSYLYMDLPSPMHWIPIHRNRFKGEVPPLEMRINAKFKTKANIPSDLPTYSSFPIKFVIRLLGSLVAKIFHR